MNSHAVATTEVVPRDGLPGFLDLFPELSKEDHKMAMIDDSLNYGGLVIRRKIDDGSDGETESSASKISVHSSPVVHSGFQLGPSSEGRVLRKPGNNGSQRKRLFSWKRKSLGQRSVEAGSASVEVQDQIRRYDSRSGYKLIELLADIQSDNRSSLPPLETQLWRKLWKTKTSPKLRHFLWRVLSGAVAVKSQLRSRGIPLDTTCSLCKQGPETVCHVLFHCTTAQDVWITSGISSPPAGWSHTSVFLNLHYLFAQSQSHNLGIVARLSFPWLLWQIWKARNKFCFEKVLPVASDIVSLAMDEATAWLKLHGVLPDFTSSNTLNQVTSATWVKPSDSLLKCNVGNVLLHSRRAFSGVLSSVQADLLALSWSAAAMSDLKMKKIIFEFSSIQAGLASNILWLTQLLITLAIRCSKDYKFYSGKQPPSDPYYM
ncbi:hypothetical protein F2Q69_00048727 [Brassica cretica]|uniref:Reverse transcriptase zinc-binding domain-containing protein n=1 Tax=Brassica cretica TaxID=69181 RepID=A0A8S9PMM2_BRACR|nr:hypothetical protein F2Q69_00048727 [Brassica cretica]